MNVVVILCIAVYEAREVASCGRMSLRNILLRCTDSVLELCCDSEWQSDVELTKFMLREFRSAVMYIRTKYDTIEVDVECVHAMTDMVRLERHMGTP